MKYFLQQIKQIKTDFYYPLKSAKSAEKNRGSILITALVFTTVFTIMSVSFINLLLMQNKEFSQEIKKQQAFYTAEAGLEYAKWRYEQNSLDTSSQQKEYFDLNSNSLGYYNLNYQSSDDLLTITSAGNSNQLDYDKSLSLVLEQKNFTDYTLFSNSPLWIRQAFSLNGKVHSNSGIRIDVQPNDTINSAVETYICTEENGGCIHPSPTVKPGIWSGYDFDQDENCSFPETAINFDNLASDIENLKTIAEQGGDNILYLNDDVLGYHLVFNSTNDVSIYEVTDISNEWTFLGHTEDDWFDDDYWTDQGNNIETEIVYAAQPNFDLGTADNLIFSTKKLWVEGTIHGKATVVVASLPEQALPSQIDIIINSNITKHNAQSVLGVIAQRNIFPAGESPDNLTIEAVFLSKNGSVFYPYYCYIHYTGIWLIDAIITGVIKHLYGSEFLERCDETYEPYLIHDNLTLNGSIISQDHHYFHRKVSWHFSFYEDYQGYTNISYNHDPNLISNPPPFFPKPANYAIIKWQENE